MQTIHALLPQTPGVSSPTPEAALAQLARAALGLVQLAGQPVPGVVLGPGAGGLTQLQIGEMVLPVRLSAPLHAGTAVRLSISADAKGQPLLQVVPVATAATPAAALPAAAAPAMPLPVTKASTPMPSWQAPELATQAPATAAPQRPQAGAPTPIAPGGVASAPASPQAPMVAPIGPAATTVEIQELAQGATRASPPGGGTAAGPVAQLAVAPPVASKIASQVAPAAISGAALAGRPATLAAPAPAAVVNGADITSATQTPGTPAAPQAGVAQAGAPAPATTASPLGPVLSDGKPQAVVAAPASLPASTQVAGMPPNIATAPSNVAASPVVAAKQSPAPAPTSASQIAAAPGQTSPVAAAQPGVALAVPYRAVPLGPQQAAPPALPLVQVLADTAQAAARQDSIVPLLARLAALGSRLETLPAPVAQAAMRLLATRLEAGGIDGKALQGAVATSGVLARPAVGSPPSTSTMTSMLLQMRGGLSDVPGAEIAAVTAVRGRPHPPVRGDDARAVRSELPLPMEGEEPTRGLLSHTDAALSRIKLLQHASQPSEARQGVSPQQELRVEVPLLIGVETTLVQLVVDREARRREQPGVRGWRMRFAFASQQTGEVGAEVALFGPAVSVALWADTPEMEAALTDGLDGLRAALVAEGLEAGNIRVRRRDATASHRPGALMDTAR